MKNVITVPLIRFSEKLFLELKMKASVKCTLHIITIL
jgi:hypothetical protein